MYSLAIVTTVLNTMFFVAGIDKFFNFDKVVKGLQQRIQFPLPSLILQFMIVCAILIEIVAPIIILKSSLHRTKESDRLAAYASMSLIVFTILATLIYHFPPFTSAKYYPFMSNLSTVGGLSLMWCIFNGNLLK